MKKRKVISIIIGVLIIITAVIMSFHLVQICDSYSGRPVEIDTMGCAGVVQILATFYSSVICILTVILVVINVLKK